MGELEVATGAGYCASGATSEDILPYFFGSGSNGKSSFAETLMAALGDYALVFAPEVMMEARGERHPTELAQFMGGLRRPRIHTVAAT